MSHGNILDRAFPPEECIPEELAQLAEQTFDHPLALILAGGGAVDNETRARVHMQDPFTTSVEYWNARGATFDHFYQCNAWNQLFQKLTQTQLVQ